MSTKGDLPLLRLPLELRQNIYALILPDLPRFSLCSAPKKADPGKRAMIYQPKSEKPYERGSKEEALSEWRTGILSVSRALSNDVLDFMYGQAPQLMFIDCAFEHFRRIGAANLQRIRRLCIVVRSMWLLVPDRQPMAFDPELWHPPLEGLQQLSIVAQQPLAHRGYYGPSFEAPTFEEQLDNWTAWLDPVLEYFSTHISKETVVSVDADNLPETTAVMDRHFSSGIGSLVA